MARPERPPAAVAAARPAARPAPAGGAGPSARLRLHGEWQEQGVRIWLGADQSLQLDEDSLRQLGQLLQRLCQTQGGALVSLVCNGKVVLGPAADVGAGRRGRVAADGAGDDRRSPGAAHDVQPLLLAIRNYTNQGGER
jgi:hypothetical protein